MTTLEALEGEVAVTAASIQRFHGLEEGLPSVYRCLAQWPGYLTRAWTDLEPAFEDAAFQEAVDGTIALVDEHVGSLPYSPRLAPEDLRSAGFDDDLIEAVQGLFRGFNTGPVESVIRTLPVFARTLDVEGERAFE